MPADTQVIINVHPSRLYKISGETKGSFKFEIEVVNYQDQNSVHSSAVDLLSYCNNALPDDIHAMVMYGDETSYNGLTTDNSKTILSQELLEHAPYEKQLHCINEEVMAIALERFLLPQLTSGQASAYHTILIRICTRLTKGWLCQFVIDNFPCLVVCDKGLLPICNAILKKNPASVQMTSNGILKESISNLDDLCII